MSVCLLGGLIVVKIFRNGYLTIRQKIFTLFYFSENNIITKVFGVVKWSLMWSNIESIREQIKQKFHNKKKNIVQKGKEEDHQSSLEEYIFDKKDVTQKMIFLITFLSLSFGKYYLM